MKGSILLTYSDILPLTEFEKIRHFKKQEILPLKKLRQLSVGPDITFYFENIQTIWWQIQEMLRIEKGGEAQIGDELRAYNPLIPVNGPNGYEISATMMIEIDDPIRRQVVLKQLFGIDQQISFTLKNTNTSAFSIDPTEDRNRESDQKTSSVHFLKWLLSAEQVNDFLNNEVSLSISNPHYIFETFLPLTLKNSFKDDFGL